jgi:hypothetical protein
MATDLVHDVKSFLEALRGLRCWYVSVGGSTLPTFQLALGEKVRRARVLMNKAHAEEYRVFEGEAGLLVWCSWRLDSPMGPITSSEDDGERTCRGLQQLKDAKIRVASATAPGMDLRVGFSNRLTLRVFCDRVHDDTNSSTNWEMWNRDQRLEIAAASRVTFAQRDA